MKTYLITGATSGIGEACALRCLEQGHKVVAICRNLGKAKVKFGPDISLGNFVPLEYDFMCNDQLYQFCLSELKNYKIDRLIHCAGVTGLQKITSVSHNTLRDFYEINVFSLTEIVRSLLRLRPVDQELSMIALSSVSSHAYLVQNGAYGMTKDSVEYYIKILNKQINAKPAKRLPVSDEILDSVRNLYGQEKISEQQLRFAKAHAGLMIRINAIAPALIVTPMTTCDFCLNQGMPLSVIPMSVVVDSIFWLIENQYISGQTLVLNNNWLC